DAGIAVNVTGDATPPTVAITSPGSGVWTGNSIRIDANASDNISVSSLKVYGNGGVVLTGSCTGAATCTLSNWWTTGSLPAGAYQIQAVATDAAGNCAITPPVTINKDATSPVHASGAPACGGSDTTPPTVTITGPVAGSNNS